MIAVRKRREGRIYALKRLPKRDRSGTRSRCQWFANVRAERDALAEIDSEWVVKLYSTFQDATHLYLVMECLQGGDLWTLVTRSGCLDEKVTAFYAAEITLALEAVHGHGYIHRDVKLDNILLDRSGHIKLADFGLCKSPRVGHDFSYYQQLLRRGGSATSAFGVRRKSPRIDNSMIEWWRPGAGFLMDSDVGTTPYMAPEVLDGQAYSYETD